MPIVESVVECDIPTTYRTSVVSGMFDVPIDQKLSHHVRAEVPSFSEDWQVGVIVGPSGSGKSTLARQAFGKQLHHGGRWLKQRAIVDGFPARQEMKAILRMLMAVGLSSPPAWCKPYHVLSTGEQFRCDLAKALLMPGKLAVVDEYSSVVDRKSAQLASAALRRSIDQQHVTKQFVAVTCHRDIIRWLAPDWVVEMPGGTLTWRSLRRPRLQLSVQRCRRSLWTRFAAHHYLDGSLNPAARCFAATHAGQPVVFAAVLNHFRKRRFRFTRLVTVPPYQGLGIGGKLLDGVAEYLCQDEAAELVTITGRHPGMIGHCNRSDRWEFTKMRKTGTRPTGMFAAHPDWKTSHGSAVASFRWTGY